MVSEANHGDIERSDRNPQRGWQATAEASGSLRCSCHPLRGFSIHRSFATQGSKTRPGLESCQPSGLEIATFSITHERFPPKPWKGERL